jgi:opacity protein-like surface antigen
MLSYSTIAPYLRRTAAIAAVVLGLTFSSSRDAAAQGFVSPFIGYNFGGNSGCPEIDDCEDKKLNWGVGFGALGPIVGFEAEFAYADGFFGDNVLFDSSVLTFMGNFMLAPRIGFVQPYALAGLGLIKTNVDIGSSGTLISNDNNHFGWDVGGGLMVFFGRHVGVRGDVRYFHAFQDLEILDFDIVTDDDRLDFGRFSGAVVFRF